MWRIAVPVVLGVAAFSAPGALAQSSSSSAASSSSDSARSDQGCTVVEKKKNRRPKFQQRLVDVEFRHRRAWRRKRTYHRPRTFRHRSLRRWEDEQQRRHGGIIRPIDSGHGIGNR